MMMKKPEYVNPDVFSFIYPLMSEVWICVAFACISVVVVLFIVSQCSPSEWRIVKDGNKEEAAVNNITLCDSLWYTVGAVTGLGGSKEPRY